MTGSTARTAAPSPVRIQRTRARGYITARGDRYRGPVRYAGRPTLLGNPFTPAQMLEAGYTSDPATAHVLAVAAFRSWLTNPGSRWDPGPDGPARRTALLAAVKHLAGVPLACWCRPFTPGRPGGQLCHVDVLLELANPLRSEPGGLAVLLPNAYTRAPYLTHAITVAVVPTPPEERAVFGPLWRQISATSLCGRASRHEGEVGAGGADLNLVTCPDCLRSPTWVRARDPFAGQTMVMRDSCGARVPVTVLGWEPPTGRHGGLRGGAVFRAGGRAPFPTGRVTDVAVVTGEGETVTVPWRHLRRPRVVTTTQGPVAARRAWPQSCYVKGGRKGIVVDDFTAPTRAYETAFVEVVPIDPPTFLRGEASDLAGAEDAAWRRYQAAVRCRHGAGFGHLGRTDGYGYCRLCGAGLSASEIAGRAAPGRAR